MNSKDIANCELKGREKKIGFSVYDYGEMLVREPVMTSTPLRASFYQFTWIEAGSGVAVVDGKEFPYGPNTVFIVQPGQVSHTVRNAA